MKVIEGEKEHGKQTERHGWLTANETKHIISKTNQSRKEEAYEANETGTVYHQLCHLWL